MVTFYSTVNMFADTGIRMKEFLDKHPKRFKNTTTFVDAAVNEKITREEQLISMEEQNVGTTSTIN